jgi:hypothetical protein
VNKHAAIKIFNYQKECNMMFVIVLVTVNVFLHGIIAGISIDVALVKLPTRKRIGPVAYAHFARNNDLGNGIVVYPALGITVLILTFVTTIIAFFFGIRLQEMIPLYVTCVLAVAHTLATANAAPIMLSLKTAKDKEKILEQKLDRFAFWHAIRTVFQVVAFISWIWALILIR